MLRLILSGEEKCMELQLRILLPLVPLRPTGIHHSLCALATNTLARTAATATTVATCRGASGLLPLHGGAPLRMI